VANKVLHTGPPDVQGKTTRPLIVPASQNRIGMSRAVFQRAEVDRVQSGRNPQPWQGPRITYNEFRKFERSQRRDFISSVNSSLRAHHIGAFSRAWESAQLRQAELQQCQLTPLPTQGWSKDNTHTEVEKPTHPRAAQAPSCPSELRKLPVRFVLAHVSHPTPHVPFSGDTHPPSRPRHARHPPAASSFRQRVILIHGMHHQRLLCTSRNETSRV
jgi:hypothetical protein